MSDINFEFWSRKKLNDESVKILGHWKQDRDFLNIRIQATKAYQELLLDAQDVQQKRLILLEARLEKAMDLCMIYDTQPLKEFLEAKAEFIKEIENEE